MPAPGKKNPGSAGGLAGGSAPPPPPPPPRTLRQATLPFGTTTSKKAAGPQGRRPAAPPFHPPPGALDLGHGARLLYLPAAIPDADGAILRALETEVEWLQRDVTVWGRTVPQRRLVAYQARPLAQPYSYSGLALPPTPWTPAVATIKAAVEAAAGCAFDTCLLNLYRDGTDAMAWHADGDALYGPPPNTIASASFGAGRAFQLRPTPAGVADGSPAIPASRIELTLGGGDVLLMQGTTQRDWQHAVPPRARVGGVRVNLTFRATAAFKELQRREAGAP